MSAGACASPSAPQAGAARNLRPDRVERQPGQSCFRAQSVKGRGEIGRRIGQGPVEVKENRLRADRSWSKRAGDIVDGEVIGDRYFPRQGVVRESFKIGER